MNVHFRKETYNWFSSKWLSTTRKCSMFSFLLLLLIRMSSRYTFENASIISLKIEFIRIWKVAGALLRPIVLTSYSYWRYFVVKAVFSLLFDFTLMYWKPVLRSSFEKRWLVRLKSIRFQILSNVIFCCNQLGWWKLVKFSKWYFLFRCSLNHMVY